MTARGVVAVLWFLGLSISFSGIVVLEASIKMELVGIVSKLWVSRNWD